MSVKPIPDGYHSVTPNMIVDGAAAALDFYRKAFGAKELIRMPMGDKIGHAEIQIGDSAIMLSDEWPDMGHLGPTKHGGTTVSLMITSRTSIQRSSAQSRRARKSSKR